jgi:hypothetical protein
LGSADCLSAISGPFTMLAGTQFRIAVIMSFEEFRLDEETRSVSGFDPVSRRLEL